MRLRLILRDHCPLCDEAMDSLAAARAPEFDCVWIDGDAVLEARYGDRVPVLCRDEGAASRELDWPFLPEALRAFLGGDQGS